METIKSSAEVSLLFRESHRYKTRYVTILVRERDGQHDLPGRVAFIAGKKLGCAVWRNRAKRRLRVLAQKCYLPLQGFDVLLIANRYTTEVSFDILVSSTQKLLEQQGISHGKVD